MVESSTSDGSSAVNGLRRWKADASIADVIWPPKNKKQAAVDSTLDGAIKILRIDPTEARAERVRELQNAASDDMKEQAREVLRVYDERVGAERAEAALLQRLKKTTQRCECGSTKFGIGAGQLILDGQEAPEATAPLKFTHCLGCGRLSLFSMIKARDEFEVSGDGPYR